MDVLKLYFPLTMGITLAFFAFKAKFKETPVLIIRRFGFDFLVTNNTIGKIVFLSGSLLFLTTYIHMDYTPFFPTYLEMEVFYDEPSIQQNLAIFTEKELDDLGYQNFSKNDVDEYYKSLDSRLNELFEFEEFFSVRDGLIYSKGNTTFKVQQTDGFQKYYMAEAKGELEHTVERPGKPAIRFLSFFENTRSPHNFIRPKIIDLLTQGRIVVAPRFKQIIAEENRFDGVLFNHVLVGVTKIYLFPYPRFSNSIYFIETKNQGLVPVAYAVYR
ncbi:MAG: hypothetical protein WBG32_17580 [Nodosilinea sp.]